LMQQKNQLSMNLIEALITLRNLLQIGLNKMA